MYMPTCPSPSKKTRSPGWSWSYGTCVPMFACAYAYMTSPEQSNPPGEAPPHTYGTPRYDIAIETTWLLYAELGTTVAPSGVDALAPTTVSESDCACAACAAATCAAAARAACS